MQRIHKATVKAMLRKGQKWEGYIAPSNVSYFHIKGGWHLGHRVTVSTVEELERYMREFAFYNCNSELGNRVVCWEEG